MIRRAELAFWALLSGTALAELSCGSPAYGNPSAMDYSMRHCTCTARCPVGLSPSMVVTSYEEDRELAEAELQQRCMNGDFLCGSDLPDACTCVCEEDAE